MAIKFKTGWRKSPHDERDFKFSVPHEQAKALPAFIDLSNLLPPCYDQGQLSSCTAQAIAAAIQFDEIKERNLLPEQAPIPSRLFIYYNERLLEGSQNEDNGATIRDGVKVCNTTGFVSEEIYPYEELKVNDVPPEIAYSVAAQHKIKVYRNVAQDSFNIRGALAGGFPVICGIQIYDNINDTETTGIYEMPSANSRLEGGHCILITGYNDETKMFKIRNSWSPNWGQGGYFFAHYDFIFDENLSSDFWVINTI